MHFDNDRSPFGPPPASYGVGWIIAIAFIAMAASYFLAERFRPQLLKLDAPQPPAAAQIPPTLPARNAELPSARNVTYTPPPFPAAAPVSPTATIYLCKGYGGNVFWSNTICHAQRATIDRMTTVPRQLSFNEQVAIAQAQADAAAPLYAVAPSGGPARIGAINPSVTSTVECAGLRQQIVELDQWARSSQSGQSQDRIREVRMRVRSRMNVLQC